MPRRPTAILLVLTVGAMALSGCSDGRSEALADATPEELPKGYELAVDGHDDGTGSIVGYVVDDEHLPLRGAVVGFTEPEIAAVTDKHGWFEIGQLEPRKWDLYVIHLGHKADGIRVNVQPNQATKVTFVLPVLPIEEPWVQSFPFNGQVDRELRVYGYGLGARASQTFELGDDATTVEAIAIGADWDRSNNLNTGVRVALRVDGARNSEFLAAGGPEGPVEALADQELVQKVVDQYKDCDASECTLQWQAGAYYERGLVNATGNVAFAENQRFDVVVDVFYRMSPAPDHTVFDGV